MKDDQMTQFVYCRDALSIFDQVVSFTGGQVTYQKTIENLNVIDYDYYFRFTDMFLSKQIPDSMVLLNEILAKGFDGSHLISGLMLHLRNLLVSRDACTIPLLEVSDEMRERYKAQAAKCSPKFPISLRIISTCSGLNAGRVFFSSLPVCRYSA